MTWRRSSLALLWIFEIPYGCLELKHGVMVLIGGDPYSERIFFHIPRIVNSFEASFKTYLQILNSCIYCPIQALAKEGLNRTCASWWWCN